jgi:hypothetical protein
MDRTDFKCFAISIAAMTSASRIVFTPALGRVVTVPPGAGKVAIYATTPRSAKLEAKFDGGAASFEQIHLDSAVDLLTYAVYFDGGKLPEEVSVFADGVALAGTIKFTEQRVRGTDREFLTEIELDEGEDFKSQKLDWLDIHNWEGWAWYRPRDTWIEAHFTTLTNLSPHTPTHNLLLHPANVNVDSNSVLAVFPASTQEVFLNLSGARDGESPGVYARARRVKRGGKIKTHVAGKLTVHQSKVTAIKDAIDIVCAKQGIPGTSSFKKFEGESPFDRLGFCTWSSIGENVPLTLDLMVNLVQLLAKDQIPIGTFIIDDGWQDIRYGVNGDEKSRGLWDFGTWEVMNAQLSEVVALVKKTLPTVKDVGVWMTLAGYWNSIAPNSPLAEKYEMRTFKLNRDNVPGIVWPDAGFDGQQSGSINNPEDRTYCLPPPHLAYIFWKDYFSSCAEAGITFAKVDNQAYGSYLDGVEGGEQFVAMWNGMTKAANEVFGENKIIHCMAHYERTFSGDIGMGVPTGGKRIVIRNSDDFGLERPNVHRNHIQYNIFNAMLNSQLCFIPDADMFMTAAQWPEYHAVLRSFFEGPILLADKPGASDLAIVSRLIGRSPGNIYETVTAPETIRLLARNVWEKFLDAGEGPAIKGAAHFPNSNSASIVLWNSRQDGLYNSSDIIFEGDVIDALNGTQHSVPKDLDVAIWQFATGNALFATVNNTGGSSEYDPIFSQPLLSITLVPEAVEILTIAPFHSVGSIKIASLGLIDKYAGLAAVKNSKVIGNKLSTDVVFDGTLGFLISSDMKDLEGNINVTVDGNSQAFSVVPKGGSLNLVQVDLTEAQACQGKTSWVIEVALV